MKSVNKQGNKYRNTTIGISDKKLHIKRRNKHMKRQPCLHLIITDELRRQYE